MSESRNDPFDKIQQQANVNPDQIYKVAESVKHADFSDEKTVRMLIQRLSKIAGKPISKAKEDKIVESITNNNMPTDMQTLNQLFKK
ncbi:stage VI sporulation protein F [Virgibacillus siamensis]|uniref:stage VI sporulation protein F n=1 Tax=Virgibacillus siamensis TaxID=480071 RepID=UPI001FEA19D4|nr:stage VI sporulation protein F [Virgibacillus siamensis]